MKKNENEVPVPEELADSLPMPRTPDEWFAEIGGAYAEAAEAMAGFTHVHNDPDEFISYLIASAMGITELRRGVDLGTKERIAAMGRVTDHLVVALQQNQPRYAECPSMVFACAYLQAHVEFEKLQASECESILAYCDCRLLAQG